MIIAYFYYFCGMKAITLIVIYLLMCGLNVQAHSALDTRGRLRLKELTADTTEVEPIYVGAIIKIDDEAILSELDRMGVVIFRQRENLLLACVPIDKIEDVSRLTSVQNIRLDAQAAPVMDCARVFGSVDRVAVGVGLPKGYDGSGVVVGFADVGFDPNHINFKSESGESRVKRLVNYDESRSSRMEMSTEEAIASWTTDDSTAWHATHVAGVLTGSFTMNGFQGVAPAADIVATTSRLSDVGILAGVEDIVEYAKAQGKPAVINLSLGYYVGPHDGTDLFCQYLDKIGEEAVVCIAAGNEGHHYNCLGFDIASSDTEYKTFIYDQSTWVGKRIHGYADFWSADNRGFEVAISIYDRVENVVVYTSPFVGGDELLAEWGTSSTDDVAFATYFEGDVDVYTELNDENNRYNVFLAYDVVNKELDDKFGRYYLGVTVKGDAGMHIDGYTDGSYSFFNSHGVLGYMTGTSVMSISNIACGHNVAVIGACNSRNNVPTVNGNGQTFGFNVSNVAHFSGYGTLSDGRALPHFCAPGNMVVSSISTPYVETLSDTQRGELATTATVDDRDYYWLTECGTSMSCPYAAGVFALWLQADPILDVHQLIDIAQSTAQASYSDIENPRWGAGCIDAHAGMVKVLEQAGLTLPVYDATSILLTDKGFRRFGLVVAGEDEMTIKVYAPDGIEIYASRAYGGNAEIDMSAFAPGIYIVEITGRNRYVEKIILK